MHIFTHVYTQAVLEAKLGRLETRLSALQVTLVRLLKSELLNVSNVQNHGGSDGVVSSKQLFMLHEEIDALKVATID